MRTTSVIRARRRRRRRNKEQHRARIYQVDDSGKAFGKAVVYVQDAIGDITRHEMSVHKDTDVTAMAWQTLEAGEFAGVWEPNLHADLNDVRRAMSAVWQRTVSHLGGGK